MKTSEFIIALSEAMCDILVRSMRSYEQSGEKDADGIPLSSEWAKESFLLAYLRDFVLYAKNEINDYDDEK